MKDKAMSKEFFDEADNNLSRTDSDVDPKLEQDADQLAAAWVVGDRTWVMSELTDYSNRDHAITAWLTLAVYDRIPESDRGAFSIMLYYRT